MINKLRVWLIALTILTGLGMASQATAADIGDLTTYHPFYVHTEAFTSPGAISDSYQFSLPSAGSFSALLASLSFSAAGITGLTLDLSGPGLLATYTPSPSGTISTGNLLLTGGTYFAAITGLVGAGGGVYNLQMAASLLPVPEPSGWMMLLAGLGLVGFMAKRRSDLV